MLFMDLLCAAKWVCAGFVHMQYVDDEGDKVLLATDTDLVAAVNFARISGWKVSIITFLSMIEIYVHFFNMCL